MGPASQTVIQTQLTLSLVGFTVFADRNFRFRDFISSRLRGGGLSCLVLVSLSFPELLCLVGEVTVLGFSCSGYNTQLLLQLLNDLVFSFTLVSELFILLLVVLYVGPVYQELVQSSLLLEGLESFRELVERYVGEGPDKGITVHLFSDLADLKILGVETLTV